MLLREDKKKLVGIGIVCLVAAGVLLCLAFLRDGKRLFSIDAQKVAAVELGYQWRSGARCCASRTGRRWRPWWSTLTGTSTRGCPPTWLGATLRRSGFWMKRGGF